MVGGDCRIIGMLQRRHPPALDGQAQHDIGQGELFAAHVCTGALQLLVSLAPSLMPLIEAPAPAEGVARQCTN